MGRQPDPFRYADGLSAYGYVGSDPVAETDPLGLCLLGSLLHPWYIPDPIGPYRPPPDDFVGPTIPRRFFDPPPAPDNQRVDVQHGRPDTPRPTARKVDPGRIRVLGHLASRVAETQRNSLHGRVLWSISHSARIAGPAHRSRSTLGPRKYPRILLRRLVSGITSRPDATRSSMIQPRAGADRGDYCAPTQRTSGTNTATKSPFGDGATTANILDQRSCTCEIVLHDESQRL